MKSCVSNNGAAVLFSSLVCSLYFQDVKPVSLCLYIAVPAVNGALGVKNKTPAHPVVASQCIQLLSYDVANW